MIQQFYCKEKLAGHSYGSKSYRMMYITHTHIQWFWKVISTFRRCPTLEFSSQVHSYHLLKWKMKSNTLAKHNCLEHWWALKLRSSALPILSIIQICNFFNTMHNSIYSCKSTTSKNLILACGLCLWKALNYIHVQVYFDLKNTSVHKIIITI